MFYERINTLYGKIFLQFTTFNKGNLNYFLIPKHYTTKSARFSLKIRSYALDKMKKIPEISTESDRHTIETKRKIRSICIALISGTYRDSCEITCKGSETCKDGVDSLPRRQYNARWLAPATAAAARSNNIMAQEENAFDSRSNTAVESEQPLRTDRANIPSIPRGKHKLFRAVVYRSQFYAYFGGLDP